MLANGQHEEQSHVARVTNIEDPKKLGRIKVACVALLGDEERELPGWIESALPWGWFTIPDVGQQVTISLTTGTSSDVIMGQSGMTSPNIRWNGITHFTNADAEDGTPVGDEFTGKNYGKRRGFKTPSGHVMLFDDTAGDEQIRMSWAGGTEGEPKTAFWAIDKDGSFMVQDAAGSLFYMNAADGETSLMNKNGHRIVMNEDGISMLDKHGNSIVMGSDGISFISEKPITFNGADHIFSNALHFSATSAIPGLNIPVNVGSLASMFNPLTIEGQVLINTGFLPLDALYVPIYGTYTLAVTDSLP